VKNNLTVSLERTVILAYFTVLNNTQNREKMNPTQHELSKDNFAVFDGTSVIVIPSSEFDEKEHDFMEAFDDIDEAFDFAEEENNPVMGSFDANGDLK
jgi:hypothetical protein